MSAQISWSDQQADIRPHLTLKEFWALVLEPLASLKLTVVLFALSIFIIFAGTLAQVDKDIWEVIRIYFRAPIAWIDPLIFFPPAFFPEAMRPKFLAGYTFPFPGGWLIGAVMALNLVAAHLVRFQVQARGVKLALGSIVILIGGLLAVFVIRSGSNKVGLQAELTIPYFVQWMFFSATVFIGWAVFAWNVISARKTNRKSALLWTYLLIPATLLAVGASAAPMVWEDAILRFIGPGLRIMGILTQCGFVATILLIGCILVFGKRGGVVLLHGGVGLMMFGELLVGLVAVEGQMPIAEGQTANYVHDVRTWELAIIDPSDPKENRVTTVPKAALQNALKQRRPITDSRLPFRVEVLRLALNANIRDLKSDETAVGTKGVGRLATFDELPQVSGVSSSGKFDMPATFLKITSPDGTEELGTYLLGLELNPQDVTVGDKTYHIGLRFKRTYKPYSITLKDVQKNDYLGTNTPRNYSSDIVLNDDTRNVHGREVKIWMNNPLRFAGETFYQSSYHKDMRTGEETTTLAVVSNTGWMIPYMSCMIVLIGMVAHFSMTLFRFLQRADRMGSIGDPAVETEVAIHDPRRRAAKPATTLAVSQPKLGPAGWLLPAAVVALAALGAAMQARVPQPKDGQFDLYRFGQIPVVADGRSKPVDTMARHALLAISGKQTFVDANEQRQPAVKWFLDMVVTPPTGAKHHVIRIENLEVQELLGLPRREGFRYSLAEVFDKFDKFMEEAQRASKVAVPQQSVYQRKLLELKRKIDVFNVLFYSFVQPQIPLKGDGEQILQNVKMQFQRQQALKEEHPPFAIPPVEQEEEWETYASGWLWNMMKGTVLKQPTNPFTNSWEKIFDAYERRNFSEFNSEVSALHGLYVEKTPAEVNLPRVDFEAYFNRVQPMTLAIGMYVMAFVIAAVGWLCLAFNWPAGLRIAGRTAFALTAFTLIVHTLALASRMYISGRPPVTNLYSSAVFIGWGCVVLGLILEALFRIGFGNVVAAVAGYSTLLIAWRLESDGSDTFSVMQAVLDTQFWLATHVTCITLGYATTYLAGLFGLIYILLGVATPWLSPQLAKDLNRMTYGTLCFSILFSFVGTVLGGLWADDSWGRFWGWDPKENGALMIVLWNALALHARWGKLVNERGLAVLAVAGNIVVSWSWFGVNALSVGLHSYGFDSRIFTLFCTLMFAHLPIMALGMLPPDKWLSRRRVAV